MQNSKPVRGFDGATPRLAENRFGTREGLARGLASHIADALADAIAARGKASIAVSGGTTPEPLFRELATRAEVPWDRVQVTLSDERWVDPDHPDSNAGLVRRCLLQGDAAAAGFVPLKAPGERARDGLAEVEGRVLAMPRPFDVMLLGMGEDGHTASLFPWADGLWDALSAAGGTCVAAIRPPKPGPDRITLTLPALLDSRQVLLLITGDAKWQVLETARGPGPVEEMPVRGVLRQTRVPVSVWWAP